MIDNSVNIETIWDQLSSGLRSFIYSRVRNDSDTDDILQNAFLRIHDNINNLKDSSKVKSWIYSITRNLITDHFRNSSKYPLTDELYTEPSIQEVSNDAMDEAIADMLSFMNELSPEYCEALWLTEIEGLTQKEYAERAGLTLSGAKSRVQRARIMVKEMLLNCCHYELDKYGTVIDIEARCCRYCPPEKK